MSLTQSQQSTVFVLDDEPAIRDSLRDLLESENYRVETFDSPREFLASAADSAEEKRCLILDLKMSEMHGLAVLENLRLQKVRLPVIVLTAYAEVPSVVSAMKSGAVNLLEKPCSDEQLLDAVHDAIAQSLDEPRPHLSADALRIKVDRLSGREREILTQLISGKNVKQIALQLGTSPNTVRNQRASILHKMEAASMTELVRITLAAS